MRAALPIRLPGAVVLVGGLVLLAGCRPGTALHSRYNDFRAYYNAYYNAEQKLQEGEETLQSRNQRVDRGRLVELFPTGSTTAQGGPFQETVDKSAELLRDRPGSKWADDALLLIGKAYFYQRNFVGAEQKFRETAQAAEARDQPRLADEARFWLGRTFAATERYDDGVVVLQAALAEPDIDRRWRAQILLALGELYGRAERWADASASIREGIDDVGDADLAARAYLLLGQVEEAAGNWEAAADAYTQAARRAPAYEVEYAARLSEALVLGLDADRGADAVDRIRAMRRDDKNFDQRAEVELTWARIEAATGERDAAYRRFREVLYDETLAGTQVRGEAHFRLAEFYRDVDRNFVRASAHFDTAATALPATPDASVQLSRAAIRNADREAETFRSVAATSGRIAEIDSLVTLASLDSTAFAARIEAIEAERLRVFLAEQRQENQLRANQAFGGTAEPRARASDAGDVELQRSVSGFLGHRDPATVQASRVAFEQTWGERDLVPNWRRRAAIEAGLVASTLGSGGRDVARALNPAAQGLPPLDLSAIPRTLEERQVLDVELSELRYELANALFLSLGRADSALALYRLILDETPDAPVAPRARYALAEVELAAGRPDAATPLFRDVIDADSASTLARAARVRLGLAPPDDPEDRPELADDSAERFAAARAVWRDGEPLAAVQAFNALGEADPDAPVAPRAFLAAAAAYADYAAGDSLRLVAALPDSLAPALLRADLEAEDASDGVLDNGVRELGEDQPVLQDESLVPDLDEERAVRPGAPRQVTADDTARSEIDDEVLVDDERRVIRPAPDDETPVLDEPRRVAPPVGDEALDADVDDERRPSTESVDDSRLAVPPVGDEALDAAEVRADSLLDAEPVLGSDPVLDAEPIADADSLLDAEPMPAADSLLDVGSLVDGDSLLDVESVAGADSLLGSEGRLPEANDASGLAVGDLLALSDTLAVPVDEGPVFRLEDFLDAIAARYPNTLEAERASALREALPAAERPVVEAPVAAAPDSGVVVPEIPGTAPSSDSTGVAPPEAAPGPPPVATIDLDANPFGTFGDNPLVPSAGGYSRRTNGLADAVEASTLARQLVAEGYRVAVATDGDDVFVIVGQYPTDKALALASAELPAAALGAGTSIVQILDVELLPLADGEDGP